MSSRNNQVFFDASGIRSRLLHSVAACLAICLAGLAIVFAISAATSPALPSIVPTLSEKYLPMLAKPITNKSVLGPSVDLEHARMGAGAAGAGAPRFAFYVNWDPNSFYSLRANAEKIDVLVPEWLHLSDGHGAIELDDPSRQEVTGVWLRANAPKLQVMPLVNNFDPKTGKWLVEETKQLLQSGEARGRFVARIRTYLVKGGYAGIVLDFKDLPDDAQSLVVTLIEELKRELKGHNKKILAVLPAYETPSSYLNLAEAADQVIMLAYDQHSAHEEPGPQAGQGWFEALLDKRFANVSGNKLIVAIGATAIDWNDRGESTTLSLQAAWDILQRSGAKLEFDELTLNPTFSYRDSSDGRPHTVWLLDGVTMFNQTAAALAMKPGGLAIWRLGTEDPSVWATFGRGRGPNKDALAGLTTLEPNTGVEYQGTGEVLKFNHSSQKGERGLTHVAKYNLITNQWIRKSPKPMVISRWGQNQDKVIALTFDDGPSRANTPAILDILKRKGVKASFFVVGTAAALEAESLRRIYDEGHDVGNHTFTHPDLSEISDVQLDLELNATQRVLESNLGIHSVLFRPPFVRNIEPETQGKTRTLRASAALGYITIGQRIDPLDWGRPGVDAIVSRTVKFANQRTGNIVLLHDGGGDRSQTIKALPRIIDSLRADGFRFVTIHELLGLKRHNLMPNLADEEKYISYVNRLGLALFRSLNDFLSVLFVVGIVFGCARLLAIAFAAIVQNQASKSRRTDVPRDIDFAVIVPAYNEEKVILATLASLLRSRRKDFQIVVVDDGSKDNTVARVLNAYGNEPRITLLRKRNGGKSSALNYAIQRTNAQVVVCIDADTRLAPDALELLLRHFHEDDVGAVAGNVTVGNPTTLLARFQALEYITMQSLDRRAFELVNGIGVVPGAIGAWRREAILDVGLYGTDTHAEDADLTIMLERGNWRVINEPDAKAYTEAPETIREFNKQRFRWMFGTLQVAFKHIGLFGQPGAWGLKLCTFPNIVLFQVLFTLVSPLMDLMLVAAIGLDLWSYHQHGGAVLSDGSVKILAYWAALQAVEMAFAALGLFMHGAKREWWLLPLVLLQRFTYRQLISWIALRTLLAALRGRITAWSRAKRLGLPQQVGNSAQPPAAPVLIPAE